MKRAILAASGGLVTTFYSTWDTLPVWEVIEAIELVDNLNNPEKPSAVGEVDPIGAWLAAKAAERGLNPSLE